MAELRYLIGRDLKVYFSNDRDLPSEIEENTIDFRSKLLEYIEWMYEISKEEYNEDLAILTEIYSVLYSENELPKYLKEYITRITLKNKNDLIEYYTDFNKEFFLNKLLDKLSTDYLEVIEYNNYIEYRIFSRVYDWSRVIILHLFKNYKTINNMPNNVIVNHITKNKVMYEGSSRDLIEGFDKSLYDELLEKENPGETNYFKLNDLFKKCCENYKSFK